MSGWKSFGAVPADGTVVCTAADLAAEGLLSVQVPAAGGGAFPLIVTNSVEGVRAYVNACPHQFLPLDHRAPLRLSADGRAVLCSNHEAAFDLCTGEGCSGLGLGEGLERVPLRAEGGALVIDDR